MRCSTISLAIGFPVARDGLPDLCESVSAALDRSGADVAVCDVRQLAADAVSVDALARLQLAAGRRGCRLQLRNASTELLELVTFMGLGDVLRR